jgi:hypothetical protein
MAHELSCKSVSGFISVLVGIRCLSSGLRHVQVTHKRLKKAFRTRRAIPWSSCLSWTRSSRLRYVNLSFQHCVYFHFTHFIIADEGHLLKNDLSETYKALNTPTIPPKRVRGTTVLPDRGVPQWKNCGSNIWKFHWKWLTSLVARALLGLFLFWWE